MRENIEPNASGNGATPSTIREVASLRLAVQQLADLLLMGIVADPAIALPESRVQYAATFLAKLAPASSVLHALSKMLALKGPDDALEACFDADRTMVRLACREAEAVAAVEAE